MKDSSVLFFAGVTRPQRASGLLVFFFEFCAIPGPGDQGWHEYHSCHFCPSGSEVVQNLGRPMGSLDARWGFLTHVKTDLSYLLKPKRSRLFRGAGFPKIVFPEMAQWQIFRVL